MLKGNMLNHDNINQTHLARDLGISRGYLNALLRGKMRCSLKLAVRIQEATGGQVKAISLTADGTKDRAIEILRGL